MKIIVGNTTFASIKSLSFAPETDLTGDSIPINEFQAEIYAVGNIGIGQYALLKDDRDTLWAKYWITYAEHVSENILVIRAKSPVALMSQVRLPAEVWNGKSAATAIAECMASSLYGGTALPYTLDSSFSNVTLTGFVPVQECRTRLQWICYAIGAYVKTYFNDRIEILPIDDTPTPIPVSQTFYKPSVTYNDYVTAITATAYTFTQGTPGTTDQWVEDDQGNHYIITAQKFTLRNHGIPEGAPEHTVNIDEMYLINQDNVDDILTRLSDMYFNRTEVDLSIINNAEFMPGWRVRFYPDKYRLMEGYIGACDFSFGVQARADCHLVPVQDIDAATLTITCVWEGITLNVAEYLLPLGYAYSITNPFYDMTLNGHRYIFRPTAEAVEGTMQQGGNAVTVQYAVALDYCEEILRIVSVDELSVDEEQVVTIT